MSIRYTLRHNIPADKVAAENAKYAHNQDPANVNDIQPYDFNLLRKHELAETDTHALVFRKHNGQIVPINESSIDIETLIGQEVLSMTAQEVETLFEDVVNPTSSGGGN